MHGTGQGHDAGRLSRRGLLVSGAAAGIAASVAPSLVETTAAAPIGGPRPQAWTPITAKTFKPSIMEMEGISRRTNEAHLRLYNGYVTKTNEIMTKLASVDPSTANQIFSDLRELKLELSFAIGGLKNHEIYFDILGGSGGPATGAFGDAVTMAFGSFDAYKADMKQSGIAARGFVWTAWDYDLKRLINVLGDAQNTFPIWNATPIVALDVYEHAYFIDHDTNRGNYIEAFFKNLDWDAVNRRWAMALSMEKATMGMGM